MGAVAYIHSHNLVDMPEPVCIRAGDIYEVVTFDDDVPSALVRGAKVVIVLNPQIHDGLYIINVNGDLLLVHICIIGHLNLKVISLHSHFSSGDYRLDDLDIYGQVIEIYPTGDFSNRWILYHGGVNYSPSEYERPILLKKGPRK